MEFHNIPFLSISFLRLIDSFSRVVCCPVQQPSWDSLDSCHSYEGSLEWSLKTGQNVDTGLVSLSYLGICCIHYSPSMWWVPPAPGPGMLSLPTRHTCRVPEKNVLWWYSAMRVHGRLMMDRGLGLIFAPPFPYQWALKSVLSIFFPWLSVIL